jgi:hypothetical protein
MKKALTTLLFSNSFYGLSAVALAMESNLVSGLPLNAPWLYIILFAGTVVFYSFSYNYDPHPLPGNQRAQWIKKNKTSFILFQILLILVAIVSGFMYWTALPPLKLSQYAGLIIMLAIFPLMGMLYYGIGFPGLLNIKLRQFGWFKPFIIGAVWAGCVSFMPWLMLEWEQGRFHLPKESVILLWIHNWMFISVLAILFDIKDYAADHNQSLKTFVVRVGLRKVIFSIVIPMSIIGFMALWLVLGIKSYQSPAIFFLLLPILLIIWVAFSMQKRRPVRWYLLVIDGLMPIKAICGMIASYWL